MPQQPGASFDRPGSKAPVSLPRTKALLQAEIENVKQARFKPEEIAATKQRMLLEQPEDL
jgi:hypothetical protein